MSVRRAQEEPASPVAQDGARSAVPECLRASRSVAGVSVGVSVGVSRAVSLGPQSAGV